MRIVGARADDYPTRTIRAVVPFAPAGVMDFVARIVLERVGQSLGQQIVIDNRPGAGGTIAIDLVAHAPPDGYTIVIADPAGSLAASVSLYPKLNFDPVKDLTPIALLGTSGAVLSVSNTLPAKTLQEFVALAKSRPGELMFGSAGNGTPGHLNGELFKRLTGIDVDPRSVSGRLPGGHRSDRGPYLVLDFSHRHRAAADPGGPAAPAGRFRTHALARPARRADGPGERVRRL